MRGFQKEIEKLEKISERMDKIRNDKNTDDVDKIQSGITEKITLLQTKINQLNDVRREEDTTEQTPR
jgi:archaellum component FlaC